MVALSLTIEEVVAYLENEFRLLRMEARVICPFDLHLRQDVFAVMAIEYIEQGRRLTKFDPRKASKGKLWNYLKKSVCKAAKLYMQKERRRGFVIGKGRHKGGGRAEVKFDGPEHLDRISK